MIEAKQRPSVRVVTGLAARAHSALVMRILVAGGTRGWRLFEVLRGMTAFAGNRRVQADQWERRKVVIEIDFLAPARFTVATIASLAQLPPMDIVLLVATDARHLQFLAVDVTLVALRTGHLPVLAPQGELGRFVVIEANVGPFLVSVTSIAFLAKVAVVHVLQPVAGDAREVEVLPSLVGVADLAGDLLVGADERESRLGVVEALCGPPALDAVAVIAGLAEAAGVRLILLVTSHALLWRVAFVLPGLMTAIAC